MTLFSPQLVTVLLQEVRKPFIVFRQKLFEVALQLVLFVTRRINVFGIRLLENTLLLVQELGKTFAIPLGFRINKGRRARGSNTLLNGVASFGNVRPTTFVLAHVCKRI